MADKKSDRMQVLDQPDFAGDPYAGPGIYIDGMQGAIGHAGVMKLNLYQLVQNVTQEGEPTLNRVVVGRLIMSQAALIGIHEWLSGIVDDIKSGKSTSDGEG